MKVDYDIIHKYYTSVIIINLNVNCSGFLVILDCLAGCSSSSSKDFNHLHSPTECLVVIAHYYSFSRDNHSFSWCEPIFVYLFAEIAELPLLNEPLYFFTHDHSFLKSYKKKKQFKICQKSWSIAALLVAFHGQHLTEL